MKTYGIKNFMHRQRSVLTAIFSICLVFSSIVFAQSAIEHHVWQDKRKFPAFSHTATSITGSISLSGNPSFATTGSKMKLTFSNGKTVQLVQVGAVWRAFSLESDEKVTAEIFRIDHDPGKLENGNSLCGDIQSKAPIFIVFFEGGFGSESLLEMMVFQSKQAPSDRNSPGLCGTFSYSIE